MVKPILIVGIPRSVWPSVQNVNYENIFGEIKKEYYVLAHASDKWYFNVFYEKDFNKVKYEELKQIIIDTVEKKC